MRQLPLFNPNPEQVVNPASVKHRSPFRYPGGKTWLVPSIFAWLNKTYHKPSEFIEPFAGGAIVGLSVAFEKLVHHVTLVELDEQVAAVWQTIIESDDGLWLADQVINFELTAGNIDTLVLEPNPPPRVIALQTIIRNRVNHGGILAQGAGRLKFGENGRGILSRWYPETIANRIRAIVEIQDQVSFVHGDGLTVIAQNQHRSDVTFFVDPPYVASSKKPGSRLYTHSQIDHHQLFDLLSGCAGDFLLTYENSPEIKALANQYDFSWMTVPMKNTHHAQLSELLIGKDLSWAKGLAAS